MAKYVFCILAYAFLVLGFSSVSDKELQGFQKETGISANDTQYKAESRCCISSTGFDKSGGDSRSQFVDETSNCKVSDCIFNNISFPRSIVPSRNLKFNTNTVIAQILSFLNVLLPENRLGYTDLDVNYTRYSCKCYIYILAHILIQTLLLSLSRVRCACYPDPLCHFFLYLIYYLFYSC